MKENLKLTLIQTDVLWKQVKENLLKYDCYISAAAGTDLVILPEMFATGFIHDPETVASHQEEVVDWLSTSAASNNFCILGSHPCFEGNTFYNRLLIAQSGESLVSYNKRHLFAYGGEKKSYQAGTSRIVADVAGWKILPLICYDLRFPVWSRNTEDYDILIYIANWPAERMRIWTSLLQARAIENQCFVVGVNRTGTDGNKINYIGGSMVVAPDGEGRKG
jgi:predicted amidohydrolase